MSNPNFEVVGSQKAYEQFLSKAEALPEAEVRPFRADGSITLQNVKIGLDAIAPHIERIEKELPTVDIAALLQLPDLGLAVIYAAARVDRTSDGSTGLWLEKGRASRMLLLTSAEALVAANVLPEHEVDRIKRGKGSIDMAQDNIDLAALFTKYASATIGKTAVTADQIKEAANVGTELLGRLKREGTRSTDPAAEAAAIRDRLWTLLVEGHRELRRVGMWLWLDEVDEYVPALQSRVVRRKEKGEG